MPWFKKEILSSITKWLILWFIVWGTALLLLSGRILLPVPVPVLEILVIIFSVACVLTLIIFPKERKAWINKMSVFQFLMIILSVVVFSLVYRSNLVDGFFISSHVLFQQLMVAVLIFMRSDGRFVSAWVRVLLLFGASHLLLIIFIPMTSVLAFSIPSSAVVALWVFLIQRVEYGILLSLITHLLFYFLSF